MLFQVELVQFFFLVEEFFRTQHLLTPHSVDLLHALQVFTPFFH